MISGHWRSFHLHITVKMTNTLISGFTFGRMILVKMVNSLAPSILPASSSPSGISLINCLDKNRPSASAHGGMITPQSVFLIPSLDAITKTGIMVTCNGIIRVLNTIIKKNSFPLNLYFAKANPANRLMHTVINVERVVTIKLFLKYSPNGALDKAVAKLLQINSPGHSFGGKAKISSIGFTAVTNIQ